MTENIDYGTRVKANEIEDHGGCNVFAVMRNHEGHYSPVSEDILFLSNQTDPNKSMSFDLAEARQLHVAIGQVIADADQIIEDAKPKTLTDSELLALKRGTIVQFPEGTESSYADTRWMRLGWVGNGNDFVKLNTDLVGTVNSAWALRDKVIVSTEEEN